MTNLPIDESVLEDWLGSPLSEEKKQEIQQERPFYRFLVVEYFATGEGISYWLQITNNSEPYNGIDTDLIDFKNFIREPLYFLNDIEEYEEEKFMERYKALIPSHIVKMIERKDQPSLIWQTHFHVNYS